MEDIILNVKKYVLPLIPFVFVLVMLSQFVLSLLGKIGKRPNISEWEFRNRL